MPPSLRILHIPMTLACVLLAAGCSSSGGTTPTPSPSATPSSSVSLRACDLPKSIDFPTWIPADLPLPNGIFASQRLPEEAGYHRGLFVIPVSTSEFAKFVLTQWPKAGWQLGRGDSEPGEVEDQFLKSPAFGAFKAQDMGCSPPHSILLLLYIPDRSRLPTISTQGGSPLPGRTPTPTPSPSPS